MSQGIIIALAAPSGAGKNSFLNLALKDFPALKDIITYTSRPMRHGEVEGESYHFVSEKAFKDLIGQDFFVEWSPVHDALYGIPRHYITESWDENRVPIMDVDVQGVEKIKKVYGDSVKSIFILPPSIEELRRRILSRDKKEPANLELRLTNARKEMALASHFDYQVVNDDLEKSYARFKKIVEELLGDGLG